MSPIPRNRKAALAWRTAFVALLLVAGWGALSRQGALELFPFQDKVMHASAYMVFYTVGWLAYGDRLVSLPLHLSLLAYGMGIEVLQSQTGYRNAEWADLAANFAGQCLGNVGIFLYLRHSGKG